MIGRLTPMQWDEIHKAMDAYLNEYKTEQLTLTNVSQHRKLLEDYQHFKPHLIWDWYDFGLVLKISKQNNFGNYRFAIDLQIAWLNLWVQCWQKH